MNEELTGKIERSKELIRRFAQDAVLMCSFGKDSMVLLNLVRDVTNAFGERVPPVIYHRHPWFTFKHEFADNTIRSMALEVHDYPPLACGVKAKPERLELVARYPFGLSALDLPVNTEPPVPRRDFACGLDWLLRPKISGLQWKWRNVFIGHKSSDVDPYEGAVPLNNDTAQVGGVNMVFPLREWTDADVWDYIETHNVPYDTRRYSGRTEVADKWLNPDYINACTACIDPRETAKEVFCPKIKAMVENVGASVLRLEQVPDYIQREKAA